MRAGKAAFSDFMCEHEPLQPISTIDKSERREQINKSEKNKKITEVHITPH